MDKIKGIIKGHKLLCIVLLISLVIHIIATSILGVEYHMNNDDIRYIQSGIVFKTQHKITLFGSNASGQIMPGMTYLIAFISLIFGEGKLFFGVLKSIWIIFSLLSMIGIYKIVLLLMPDSKYKHICGVFATVPLLFPTFVWMDNVILTETPFMCSYIYLIYFTIKEAKKHDVKNFIAILVLFFLGVLLKANFVIYIPLLIGYLLIKKYDRRLLIKEVLIAAGALLLFFVPWTYRNYKLFGGFIPLTYGGGNPQYWGTFQGYGYPLEEELDFDTYLSNYKDEKLKDYFDGKMSPEENDYYTLKIDSIRAKYRMSEWWKRDKLSMIVSYSILKPVRLFPVFYWDNLFGINRLTMNILRGIELLIIFMLSIIILISKKWNMNLTFLIANLIFQVAVYSLTFTFSRYGQPLMFLLFIIGAYGLNILLEKHSQKRNILVKKM